MASADDDLRAAQTALEVTATKQNGTDIVQKFRSMYWIFMDINGLLPLGRIQAHVSDDTACVLKALQQADAETKSTAARQAVHSLQQQPNGRNRKSPGAWCIPSLDLLGIFGFDLGLGLAKALLDAGRDGWTMDDGLPALLAVARQRTEATAVNNRKQRHRKRAPPAAWKPSDWTAAKEELRRQGKVPTAPAIATSPLPDDEEGEDQQSVDGMDGVATPSSHASGNEQAEQEQEPQEIDGVDDSPSPEHSRRAPPLQSPQSLSPEQFAVFNNNDGLDSDSDAAVPGEEPPRSAHKPLRVEGKRRAMRFSGSSPSVSPRPTFTPNKRHATSLIDEDRAQKWPLAPADLDFETTVDLEDTFAQMHSPFSQRKRMKLDVNDSSSSRLTFESIQSSTPAAQSEHQSETPDVEDSADAIFANAPHTYDSQLEASPSLPPYQEPNDRPLSVIAEEHTSELGHSVARDGRVAGSTSTTVVDRPLANGSLPDVALRDPSLRKSDQPNASLVSAAQSSAAQGSSNSSAIESTASAAQQTSANNDTIDLTHDDNDEAFATTNNDRPLAVNISPDRIKGLDAGGKLNDKIVNFLVQLFAHDSYYVVSSWAARATKLRRLPRPGQEIVMPLHLDDHWIVIYINPVSGRHKVMDPAKLRTIRDDTKRLVCELLSKLPNANKDPHFDFLADFATQKDACSCGVFVVTDVLLRTHGGIWPQRFEVNVARFAFLRATQRYVQPTEKIAVSWSNFSPEIPPTPTLPEAHGYKAIAQGREEAASLLATYEKRMRQYLERIDGCRHTTQAMECAMRRALSASSHDERKMKQTCTVLLAAVATMEEQCLGGADQALLSAAGLLSPAEMRKRVEGLEQDVKVVNSRNDAIQWASNELGELAKDLAQMTEEMRAELPSPVRTAERNSV